MGTHSRLSQPRTVTELAQRNPAEAYGRGRECLHRKLSRPIVAHFLYDSIIITIAIIAGSH
jgi:hypothetical protein